MTEEEKKLLFKDLCARAPYGTNIAYNAYGKLPISRNFGISIYDLLFEGYDIEHCKPYLRPMSSMTEKEQSEFVEFHCVNLCPIIVSEMLTILQESKMLDWLNSHHFDFRNLIERGLAIDCTGLNVY